VGTSDDVIEKDFNSDRDGRILDFSPSPLGGYQSCYEHRLGLFAVAALSLTTMGYHAGLTGTSRSLEIVAVAVTFSVVIELIADLDRPQKRALRVSQQALLDVQRSMTPPP